MTTDHYDDDRITCADCNGEPTMRVLRLDKTGMRRVIPLCTECADRQGLTDDPTDDGDAKLDAERDGGEAA